MRRLRKESLVSALSKSGAVTSRFSNRVRYREAGEGTTVTDKRVKSAARDPLTKKTLESLVNRRRVRVNKAFYDVLLQKNNPLRRSNGNSASLHNRVADYFTVAAYHWTSV